MSLRALPLLTLLLSLAPAPGAGQVPHPPGYDDLVRWGQTCINAGSGLEIDLRFAPVRPADRPTGYAWSYEWATEDRRYPGGRLELGEAPETVFLVSTIRPHEERSGEGGFLWHVIAVPRVPDAAVPYEGLFVNAPLAVRFGALDRRDLDALVRLSHLTGRPAFNLAEGSERRLVTERWEELFGVDVVQEVLVEQLLLRRDGRWGYDLTFYPVEVPDFIPESGHRWPSQRTVTRPGPVFGFLLDEEGSCLASAEVAAY